MFWRREHKTMPVRDVQSEAVSAIIQGSAILPSRRLTGAIFTALLDNPGISVAELETQFVRQYRPSSLLSRFTSAREVADAAVYLCSERASATTGSAMRAEGGIVNQIM